MQHTDIELVIFSD